MADSTGGMGAEVGVRKMNEDGEVVDSGGNIDDSHSRISWAILVLLIVLSTFGVWKIIELIPM